MLACLTPLSYSLSSPEDGSSWKEKSQFKSKDSFFLLSDSPSSIRKYFPVNTSIDGINIKNKYVKLIPCSHRILRALLGLALIILTLGIALLFKPVKRLFTKTHYSKIVFLPITYKKPFSSPPPILKPSLSFNEQNIQKAEDILLKNFNDILLSNSSPDISIQQSSPIITLSNERVFVLPAVPGWTFMTNLYSSQLILEKWVLVQQIQSICKHHNFNKIFIPEFQLLTIFSPKKHPTFVTNIIAFIAEQQIITERNLKKHMNRQETLYTQNRKNLREAVSQMTQLMCLTNIYDIDWRNCPILFDPDTQTHSKLALLTIDIVPKSSIYPEPPKIPSIRWIRCTAPYHSPLVKSIFMKYNKDTSSFDEIVHERWKELQ